MLGVKAILHATDFYRLMEERLQLFSYRLRVPQAEMAILILCFRWLGGARN